jgi:hypothetical protein
MTKARDLANLAGSATGLATDAEVSSAVSGLASTSYVDTAVATVDLSSVTVADLMDTL